MNNAQRSRFGPEGLAEFATRRPRRVLAMWAGIVVVSLGLIGTLLGTSLTSDSSLTNHPESTKAQELIDARLPPQNAIDEVIVVRSESAVVSDAAFAARVRTLIAEVRGSGAIEEISSYLDPGGEILVSADKHATVLPVVVAHPQDERIADVISVVEQAERQGRVRNAHHRRLHLDRDFTELSASDLNKGELQFGLPAALIVLLLVVGTLVGVGDPDADGDPLDRRRARPSPRSSGKRSQLNLFIVNMVVAMGLALGHRLLAVHRLAPARGTPPRCGDARSDPHRRQHGHPRGRLQRHRVHTGDDRHAARARHHPAQPRPRRRHRRRGVDARRARPSIPRC